MSRGYYEPVGPRHSALFLDESFDVLLVSFDTITSARAGSASGIPHGMFQAELRGWSHLSVLAKSPTWFRDPSVYGYFDRLIDTISAGESSVGAMSGSTEEEQFK